ncbi:MAG: BrnT family toxin [Alphaproteobacteria bacterium]|nr:BrnT family toxin [Alphaproteobacteria bacterium]
MFEYDANKSASNKRKHGLDFDEAVQLWDDPNAIEFEARTTHENRAIAIGQISGKVWCVIFTRRGEKIRIISVRRARRNEEAAYEENIGR